MQTNTQKSEVNMELSERAKQARRDYMNAWRKRNKDRLREYERRRWERVAQKQDENTENGR